MVFEPLDVHCTAPFHKLVFIVLDNGVVKYEVLFAFCLKALVLLKGEVPAS